ncbi:MAG: tetratricopeptide repeat protein [Planctomycetes bacterium]|nr:tetratricopeptide repeat protein [Planctomycetota bacterium]
MTPYLLRMIASPRAFFFLTALGGLCGCSPESPSAPPASAAAAPAVELPRDPSAVTDLYAHSLAVAEEAKRKLPGRAQAIFDLGNVHRRFGFDEKAIEVFNEGLRIDPRQPAILETIGFLFSQKNRLQEAIEAYHAALAIEPQRGGPRTRIGLIYTHEGKLDESAAICQEEIKNGTATADTYFNLGQALLLKKDFPAARQAFKQCIQLNQKHENVFYGLFQVERDLEHSKEAEEAMARFRAIKKEVRKKEESDPKKKSNRGSQLQFTAETYLDVCLTYLHAGLKSDSRRAIEGATLFDPGNAGAQFQLAEMLRGEGAKNEAKERCQKALAIDPQHPGALFLLAGLSTEEKQFQRSAELLEKLISLQPGDADAHREYARLALMGKIPLEIALSHAQTAVDLQKTATNLDVLAWALHRAGQKEKAIETLKEALELDPGNRAIQQRLEGALRN